MGASQMTEELTKPVGPPQVIATCGLYRVVADKCGLRLEKLNSPGTKSARWRVIGAGMTPAELGDAYENETSRLPAGAIGADVSLIGQHVQLISSAEKWHIMVRKGAEGAAEATWICLGGCSCHLTAIRVWLACLAQGTR